MAGRYIDTLRNYKFTEGKYCCWENSDYTIEIIRTTPKTAVVRGLFTTREKIRTDENGNEYIILGDVYRKQTYYAFSRC